MRTGRALRSFQPKPWARNGCRRVCLECSVRSDSVRSDHAMAQKNRVQQGCPRSEHPPGAHRSRRGDLCPQPSCAAVRLSRGSPVAVKRQLQVEAAPRWSPAFMGAFQLTWLLCIPGDTNATKPVTHSDCRKGWIQNPADPELSAHGAV